MADFQLDPTAEAKIAAVINAAIQEAALAAGEQLDENTSAGPRHGRKYPALPRTSSAQNEYPQEQFGDLNDSIDVHDSPEPFYYVVGFFGEDAEKLYGLEFKPLHDGGRKPLTRTMRSKATHDRMRDAVR